MVLTGFGEPLIDKTLEQKVEYAKNKGLRTYIISNASLLTRDDLHQPLGPGLKGVALLIVIAVPIVDRGYAAVGVVQPGYR